MHRAGLVQYRRSRLNSNVRAHMNSTFAVAYVSSAVRLLNDVELEALLLDARAFNATREVTGALLYHEGTFFQYFEGPAEAVEAVYDRVKASRLHRGLVELLHEQVQQRQFGSWRMGFTAAPRSLILALERARWSKLSEQLQANAGASAGLDLLLQFWQGSQRGFA